MKTIMSIVLLLVLSFNVFSQEKEKFSTVIPKDYASAGNIILLNKEGDTAMSFYRDGRTTSIKEKKESFFLKKRKVLLDSDNNILALYKRHKIIFPSKNTMVIEKKKKDGWEYFLEDKKILEVNYIYNKRQKNYDVEILSDNSDEITTSLIKMCLGRFDKSVVMDYHNDNDFATAIIITMIIALS